LTTKSLDLFFEKEDAVDGEEEVAELTEQPVEEDLFVRKLPPAYLTSAGYDGSRGAAYLKLYEPKSQKLYFWRENTGHKPYLFTNLNPAELEKLQRVTGHPGLDHLEELELYYALLNQKMKITKVVAKDPLSIGGRMSGSLRDVIPEEARRVFGEKKEVKVWEAYIKYYECYLWDRRLSIGTMYEVKNGNLIAVKDVGIKKTVEDITRLFSEADENYLEYVKAWANLLEYPAPNFRRVALDIEVLTPIATRVPDPHEASYPVNAASLIGNDGVKRVLLLKREGVEWGATSIPKDVRVEYYDFEKDLILEIFSALNDYPVVLTFNGDDFDLRYLWRRAQNVGIDIGTIPIEAGHRVCLLRKAVHIDLYKFFFNRSIQIYAFRKKYEDVLLDTIADALLGKRKIVLGKPIAELTYSELAQYNIQDSVLTLELTTFDNELVMKLILALTRISQMPMEDMSRQGVSRWIRNFFYYEHRRRGMLVPNKEDILEVKGGTATTAIIKGKKYKGAIVVKPKPGVHFNVSVLDFSSLYPSIIKVYNLGYQTIRCAHEECKDNVVPETDHWICRKNRALESLLIGSMRDLRVKWYKPKSKDASVSRELREWYDVIQQALKVILNASYGVFGAETFDLYCPPVAESVAAMGRHAILETVKKAQELGINVVYGDTDSVFLRAPTPEQVAELIAWSEKTLGMDLEVDKVYRYSVLSKKKNYIGIFPDGTVDIKGLTGKKKHIPTFLKEAFSEMIEKLGKVKTPSDFERAKREIQDIVKNCYLKLKRKEYPMEDLAFHVVLGKIPEGYSKTTPQHAKAAKLLQEKGYEIKAGDLISFVKTMREPHVKPIQLATKDEVDTAKYVGYIRSTFSQALEPIGLDFDEIIGLRRLDLFI